MGRVLKFKMGSFYRTDDRSGFPQRAGVTKAEWNGLIVDEKLWEIRQPQDLVKGVKDSQFVPDARPLPPNVYVGPVSVATTAAAVIGQTVIPVQTTAGFFVGAKVGCVLDFDNGAIFFTHIISTAPASGAFGQFSFGQSGFGEGPRAELPVTSPSGAFGQLAFGQGGIGEYATAQPSNGSVLQLAEGLPYPMASGNLITLYQASPPVGDRYPWGPD